MQFKDYLMMFPDITHLSGLNVVDEQGVIIHTIPAVEGKLGSLKLYNALAEKFNQTLDSEAANQGLVWFAEYVEDAKQNMGKHPNIDLLFQVLKNNHRWFLKPIKK